MDAVGGEFNAFTEKEHTCFYATVLDRDLDLAIDIVSDVVLNATIAAKDIDVERGVVLEEIAMRDDDPGDLVHDEFSAALFGDVPLGRAILGTEESIRSLSRRQVARLLQAPLHPRRDGRVRRRQRRPRRRRAPRARCVRVPARPGRARPSCRVRGR